jgi:hypothetical protein
MSLDELAKLFALIQAVATTIALVIAGIWAYTKFIYRREKEPRAEFTIDLEFVGIQGNEWLVEVSAYVENKGLVRHPVRNFKVALRYLCATDKVTDGEENIKFQVMFPHSINERIGKRERLLWKETHIDPGLRYRNSYVTFLPVEATFVLLHGSFEYEHERFTAQKVLKVPDKKL